MAKITWVRVHQEVFVPGLNKNMQKTMTPGEYPGIEMDYQPDGLYVSFKGVDFIIPTANIVSAVFAPKAKEAAKSVA